MVRILICDDQTVVREGLAAILGTDDEIEVVGLAGNGEEALALAAEQQPDLVLMDLKMPVLDGVQATRRLVAAQPGVRVLILTTYADDQWLLEAIQAGAAGYLLKDTRQGELIAAIKGTVAGRTFIDPAVAGKVLQHIAARPAEPAGPPPAPSGPGVLSEREREVLRLIALGYNNTEISQRLHLASGTVRNYVSAVLQKLGVEDRTQAAVVAHQRGLVEKA